MRPSCGDYVEPVSRNLDVSRDTTAQRAQAAMAEPLCFAPRRPVAPGPVRVAVRPEAWQVAALAGSRAATASQPPEEVLPGTLRKMAYLGSFLELTVDTPLGEVFVVSPEVDQPWQLGDALLLRLGSHGVSVVAG